MDVWVDVESAIASSVLALSEGIRSRVLGPSLGAAARVVRRRARTRGYGYGDDTRRLRKSIRIKRIPARYGGRTYKTGRAELTAGGPGARQGFPVERGHGGPRPAPAHPYLARAGRETRQRQLSAFTARLRAEIPKQTAAAARRAAKRRRRYR